MSVVFTGILCAYGLFLFSYRGHKKKEDEILLNTEKRLELILHDSTIDTLYFVFILDSTTSVMNMEAHLYPTFLGLNMLEKGGLETNPFLIRTKVVHS